eukprot:10784718-Karenia_brevis.AAC.1
MKQTFLKPVGHRPPSPTLCVFVHQHHYHRLTRACQPPWQQGCDEHSVAVNSPAVITVCSQ